MDYLFIKLETTPVNIIKFYFLLISSAVIFLGLLINFFEKYLPGFILKTFRSGKHSYKGSTKLPTIEFSKSSFKQFYEIGIFCMTFTYIFVFSSFVLGFRVPSLVSDILYMLTGDRREISQVSATNVFIATTLMALQIFRRYYDTHFVSVFAKNSKINLTHWVVGITYYPMVILSIICEAPNFTTSETHVAKLSDVGILSLLGILLFMWSWWHQYICTAILANLRKTKTGYINDYKLPMGDWFEYLSSPHCSAEILMYIALTLFLWQNSTWWYVMLWIFANQIESILLSHWWYQEAFKNFPKERKALVPYIY